jgi:hypothetical protein
MHTSWIRKLFVGSPRTVHKSLTRFRPALERLEERLAPTTGTYIFSVDGSTYYGETKIMLDATLYNAQTQQPVANEKIEFSVNGNDNVAYGFTDRWGSVHGAVAHLSLNLNAGTYPDYVTASFSGDSSYGSSSSTGDLLIYRARATWITNPSSKTYGNADPMPLTTGSGVATYGHGPGFYDTVTATYSRVPGESAGSYQITATLSAAPGVLNNYDITNNGATFTINPAPLTITPAAGQSKVYGAAVPTPLSYTFSGLVNNDPASTLTGVLGTSATAASPVGNYAFTTNLLQNYTVVLAANAPTFAVTAAPLTITAANQSMVYGAALPALTVSYSGLVNGDTPVSLSAPPSVSSTATASSHVGSYPITASGAADANYTISYLSGTLSITSAPLTITANNQSKVYGAALPALTVSYSGLVNGDTPASLSARPTVSCAATASSHVGSYPITASGAADPDYSITYAPGTLMVTPAPLTITATNQTRIQGEANPSVTVSYSGFVLGEGPSVLGAR